MAHRHATPNIDRIAKEGARYTSWYRQGELYQMPPLFTRVRNARPFIERLAFFIQTDLMSLLMA